MHMSHSRRKSGFIAVSVLVTAFLLGSCDRSKDRQDELQVTEETITQGRAATDGENTPQTTDYHEKLQDYAQQAQEPDRDVSVVADGEAQPMAQFSMIEKALADIEPTKGNTANGQVSFTPRRDSGQMIIHVVLEGLTPGKHGLHLHENGDCSADDASSAGGHFNPYNTQHGSPSKAEHHLGDLGNVEADEDGNVDQVVSVTELAFSGPASVLQTAVVVHSGEDDLKTDPSGNSGERVGCGVVRQEKEVLADSLVDEPTSGQE